MQIKEFVAKLGELQRRQYANAAELEAVLQWAQLENEQIWESGQVQKVLGADAVRTCEHNGCNHSRYPASRYCFYHVTSSNTFAARLRRMKGRKP